MERLFSSNCAGYQKKAIRIRYVLPKAYHHLFRRAKQFSSIHMMTVIRVTNSNSIHLKSVSSLDRRFWKTSESMNRINKEKSNGENLRQPEEYG